jgi:hypothetical protein
MWEFMHTCLEKFVTFLFPHSIALVQYVCLNLCARAFSVIHGAVQISHTNFANFNFIFTLPCLSSHSKGGE